MPQLYYILTLLSGRLVSVNRARGAQTVWVRSIYKKEIEIFKNREDGASPAEVLIVDRMTNTPTAYATVERPPVLSSEDFIDATYRYGGVIFGHIEFRKKHFTLFLNLRRVFDALKEMIYKWWSFQIGEVETSPLHSRANSTVLYVDEGDGLDEFVPAFFSHHGIRVQRITPDALDAPPGDERQNKPEQDVVFVILGTMAQGNTAAKALEYTFRSFSPKEVKICVLVGRMDMEKKSFWQRISSYSEKPIKFEFFSYLPTGTYMTASSCPVCNLLAQSHKAQIFSRSLPRINNIILAKNRDYQIRSLGLLERDLPTLSIQDDHSKEVARIRSIYVDAQRNYDRRKKLNSFSNKENLLCLLSSFEFEAFAEFDLRHKSMEEIEYVLYKTHKNLVEACISLLNPGNAKMARLSELLGAYAVLGSEFARRLPCILSEALAQDSRDLFENLTFMGLILPELGQSIRHCAKGLLGKSENYDELIQEILAYSSWESDGSSIDAYRQVTWLLARSSSWGDPLTAFGGALTSGNNSLDEIKTLFRAFKINGYEEISSLINKIIAINSNGTGKTLWSAIQIENNSIDETLLDFRTSFESIEILFQSAQSLDDIKSEAKINLHKLNVASEKLLGCLRSIYTNPIDIELGYVQKMQRDSLKIEVERNPDFRGILFGLRDLQDILYAVWENALRCAEENLKRNQRNQIPQYKITISFDLDERRRHIMRIYDNLNWDKGISLSGGLKKFSDYCRSYGAYAEFYEANRPDGLRISVEFQAFDPRVRNEPIR